MATCCSITLFKIILILLLTINCLIIYFQFNGVMNIKRILFEKSDVIFKIQMNNVLVDLNMKQKISDSVEKESNVALKYYNKWKAYRKNNRWKGKGIKTCDTELPSIEEI